MYICSLDDIFILSEANLSGTALFITRLNQYVPATLTIPSSNHANNQMPSAAADDTLAAGAIKSDQLTVTDCSMPYYQRYVKIIISHNCPPFKGKSYNETHEVNYLKFTLEVFTNHAEDNIEKSAKTMMLNLF